MGATWKLRAIVYGALLAIGALILVTRPGDESSAKPATLLHLRGTTSQGSRVAILMDGRHMRSMFISRIATPCAAPSSWSATVGWPGLLYREGTGRTVMRWAPSEDDQRVMSARVLNAGHDVDAAATIKSRDCVVNIHFKASG